MKGKISLFQTGLAGGGAERVMLTLAKGLCDQGYVVDLVVCRAVGPLRDEIPDSVRLVDLGVSRAIASLPALVRYLRRERPNAMLSALSSTNCIAVWARSLSRIPCRLIISEHNTLSIAAWQANARRARLLTALMRHTYPKADMVVAVSGGVADDLARTIGLARARIKVIYNPVVTARLESLSQEPVSHTWFKAGEEPVIVATGRLTQQKDFPTLLRALARLRERREARLIIFGEGEDRPHLERLAVELGVSESVEFPGFVKNPYAYMRAASLFVFSSKWEGFGNVLVEAMACGCPIVSTDCPSGPAEILENGVWGDLVPVGDSEALSKTIERALDKGHRETREQQKRAWAFSDEAALKEYVVALLDS